MPPRRIPAGRGAKARPGQLGSRSVRPLKPPSRPRPQKPALRQQRTQAASPVVAALLGNQAQVPPQVPPAPAGASGPYQGAAGSEAQNPGQQRVPPPDWASPGANYERRNYYVSPNGEIIAREPGYYNPENPFDTGRPGETNMEWRGQWDPSMERRMDEPGVTPWGPGGKASAPGSFQAPGPGRSAGGLGQASALTPDILERLFGGGREASTAAGGFPQGQGLGGQAQLPDELLALLNMLLGKTPRGAGRGVSEF